MTFTYSAHGQRSKIDLWRIWLHRIVVTHYIPSISGILFIFFFFYFARSHETSRRLAHLSRAKNDTKRSYERKQCGIWSVVFNYIMLLPINEVMSCIPSSTVSFAPSSVLKLGLTSTISALAKSPLCATNSATK